MNTHRCPAPDCDVQVPASQLMCRMHWSQVPKPLQAEVYAAWNRGRGRGSWRHAAAVRAAVEAVTP